MPNEGWSPQEAPLVRPDVARHQHKQVALNGNVEAVTAIQAGQRYVMRFDGDFNGGSVDVKSAMNPTGPFIDVMDSDGTTPLVFAAPGSREYVADGTFLRFNLTGGTSSDVTATLIRINE